MRNLCTFGFLLQSCDRSRGTASSRCSLEGLYTPAAPMEILHSQFSLLAVTALLAVAEILTVPAPQGDNWVLQSCLSSFPAPSTSSPASPCLGSAEAPGCFLPSERGGQSCSWLLWVAKGLQGCQGCWKVCSPGSELQINATGWLSFKFNQYSVKKQIESFLHR